MSGKKVIVIPCSGIGKPLGSVARQAAYDIIESSRPETSTATCLALLVSGDEDTVNMVKSNPCIALDGCPKECARKNIEIAGGTVATELRVMDVVKECREYRPETVLNIGEGGEKLSQEIARRISIEIDRILAEEVSVHE